MISIIFPVRGTLPPLVGTPLSYGLGEMPNFLHVCQIYL